MKQVENRKQAKQVSGMTVIELSLTISLMLLFSTITMTSVSGLKNWKLGRSAGEELRSVYLAQKSFLADHPVVKVADLTSDGLIPYLSGGRTAIPTVESLEGEMLNIDIKQMPPKIMAAGAVYDPSRSNKDSLWDAGTR